MSFRTEYQAMNDRKKLNFHLLLQYKVFANTEKHHQYLAILCFVAKGYITSKFSYNEKQECYYFFMTGINYNHFSNKKVY